MSDLVARIRAWQDDDAQGYDRAIELLCEAADALEQAERERDEARALIVTVWGWSPTGELMVVVGSGGGGGGTPVTDRPVGEPRHVLVALLRDCREYVQECSDGPPSTALIARIDAMLKEGA